MYISTKHKRAKSSVPSSVSANIAVSELSVKRKEKKRKQVHWIKPFFTTDYEKSV